MSRVLFTSQIYDFLKQTKLGCGNEIRLTYAIAVYAKVYDDFMAVGFFKHYYDR